jgi:uncharacterized membrane protein
MITTPIAAAVAGPQPLITNDAVVLGLLMAILGLVFWTSSRQTVFWRRFYAVVPSVLLAYFLPSLLGTANIISGDVSNLYFISSRYLLPTALVLLTLSIDLQAILRLGPKALILFLTGTVGIVIGGPVSIIVVSWFNPEIVSGDVWRGLTTVAGSWIGGGANQAAMKEVFQVGDEIFSALITVDVMVGYTWLGVLLFAAGRSDAIDRWVGADNSAVTELRDKVEKYRAQIMKIPRLPDTVVVLAVGFGVTGAATFLADRIAPALQETAKTMPLLQRMSLTSQFFWLVVLATTGGVLLSFTRAKRLEGVGASRIGSVFIYVLIASIGMKMDLTAIFRYPGLFVVGAIWIGIHASLLIGMTLLIRAPIFYMAVGSQANVGGAASAPIVAAAFHPGLAPVGVLLAVLGYALGTYAAWLTGLLMQAVATS